MSQWGALDAKYSTGAGANQRIDVPTCQQCLNGQCRRHPKQDHGRSAARLQAEAGAQASGTLDRMYDALVAPQIAKAKKDLGDFDEKAEREYAASAAKDREKALKRKRKGLGEEGQRLAASGLHGGVVGLMTRSDDDSSSSSSSSSSGDRKRRKKDKKKEKKKLKKKVRCGVLRSACPHASTTRYAARRRRDVLTGTYPHRQKKRLRRRKRKGKRKKSGVSASPTRRRARRRTARSRSRAAAPCRRRHHYPLLRSNTSCC